MIDLHMHTYFSDGRATPEEVVRHAHSIGLKTIAITDHDNVRGNIAARPTAAELGVEIIPALEMTTRWDDFDNVDLLGYFIDYDNAGLQAMIDTAISDLRERVVQGCSILTKLGLPLTFDDVQAQNPRFTGGMQIIRALVAKGYAADFNTGLTLFQHAWENVPQCALRSQDAIRIVHEAGGVVSLAHPTRIRPDWVTAEEVRVLVDAGLDAIEVYHPSVDDAAREHFMTIAEQYDLAISGGSDEHGYPQGFPRMGRFSVTQDVLDTLRKRATNIA